MAHGPPLGFCLWMSLVMLIPVFVILRRVRIRPRDAMALLGVVGRPRILMIRGEDAVIYERASGDAVRVAPPAGRTWRDTPDREVRQPGLAVLRFPADRPVWVDSNLIEVRSNDGTPIWLRIRTTMAITDLQRWAVAFGPPRQSASRDAMFLPPVSAAVSRWPIARIVAERDALAHSVAVEVTAWLHIRASEFGAGLTTIEHVRVMTTRPQPLTSSS